MEIIETLKSAGHDAVTLVALVKPFAQPQSTHTDCLASLADEHASLSGSISVLGPGADIGSEAALAQDNEWARDVIDRVEDVRSREPELNIYHICRKAGITVQLYKEARAYYGGIQ
ncbi:hypothetical protein H8F21_13750 [Pseudomonas sp. P66]|uniref:Uncharacterized protein n=1 Tax=Pseudomonas arcuscaelestis TaxID=2710591 RepID=A0ABS2C0R9_9PSED|nr:hypothetical protein [Pseudomonas arcuscaelestis]MBM5458629.1 hypothetical protein [Pseudomonas arcuscaelestis]